MAITVTTAMVDLKLKAGNARPTVQNFNASGPAVPLALGAHHVLTAMSGGEDTVTLRELEVAMFLAAYVDKERVGSALVVSTAWSLEIRVNRNVDWDPCNCGC